MITKGIRGAITVENNTQEDIKSATLELLTEMIKKNNIAKENISHAIFTLTPDLNAEFPAKFARLNFGWDNIAMMCFHELDVPNSLPKCLRILIVINTDESFEPKFFYMKDSAKLRK